MTGTRFIIAAVASAAVLLVIGWLLPSWSFVLTVAIAKAIAVLGLVLLMRAGLVSFGQALFYCIGGYTAGVLAANYKISEALIVVPLAGLLAGVTGFALGFLMRRYRDIFFAMLSLAFSMILFGTLVKSVSLGGTDGFQHYIANADGAEHNGSGPLFWVRLCGRVASVVHDRDVAVLPHADRHDRRCYSRERDPR